VLYSEIAAVFEVRKVEVYRDGRHDYAGGSGSTGTTVRSEPLLPAVDEIDADPEFSASVISADEFERVWLRATGGGCPPLAS